MRISVIIPFNKGDDFLRDCLDSLAEQEFKDYEVLLITDHYEGDINNVLSDYTGRIDIKCFALEGNKTGVAAARNLGLDHAQGDYVYFIDADDYIFQDALAVLLQAADEFDEDIVYGKKHYTYYRRSVFLPIYIEKREAILAQKYADGGDESVDNADLSDSSAEDDGDEEDEEISDELREMRELRHRNRARRKGIKRLITKKKRLRNVSVLHMIIRRSLIEEMGLRFDESLKYYSDSPFLASLLDTDVKIRKKYFSHYIKRKHADIVNHPALTQIMDPGRFDEMMKTFRILMKNSNPEGSVRRAVDHQFVVYYTNYFIKKLKRSENDIWRKKRFEVMTEMANEMLPENIRREKFYRRRMLKALKKGDCTKCIKLITRRLGRKKLKKIFKKRVLSRYLYRNKYLKKPLEENTIMFETFFGKSYSDSPKYIYEYIAKNYPGKYKFVWVLDNKQKLPYGGIQIKRFSRKYYYYLAISKYFVFNVRQPVWFKHRKDQVFFETWHGTPLKRLAFDLGDVFGASPDYKKQIYKQSRSWDFLLAANKFSSDVFRSCFKYDGVMCECGYPRNDILHAPDRDEISARIKKSLNIPEGKKLLLYAPTWRDDECYGHGQYKFELKLDLKRMRERLGDDYIVLLRTHYFIADAIDTSEFGDFTRNVCRYNDISELYLISDIIITDYSSVFFDYANLKRPMLFYTYDLEKYRDILHGFYIDMETELPGPMLFTTDEVIDAIQNIDDVSAKYAAKYDEFYERFCSWEDGHGAEKCTKLLFGEKK